jgi:hypothetical protein
MTAARICRVCGEPVARVHDRGRHPLVHPWHLEEREREQVRLRVRWYRRLRRNPELGALPRLEDKVRKLMKLLRMLRKRRRRQVRQTTPPAPVNDDTLEQLEVERNRIRDRVDTMLYQLERLE